MNEDITNYLNEVRRDFAGKPLNEESVNSNPMEQYAIWFEEAVDAQLLDPYAMSISTVDYNGQPSTRIVYMRGVKDDGFVFYTNYNSSKGKDLSENHKVSLNFFWGELERQIRIEGEVKRVSEEDSDTYFSQRPRESQLGAWASLQSEELKNREELQDRVAHFAEKFKNEAVPRPEYWGAFDKGPPRF